MYRGVPVACVNANASGTPASASTVAAGGATHTPIIVGYRRLSSVIVFCRVVSCVRRRAAREFFKTNERLLYGVRIEFERGAREPMLRVGNSLHRVETESIYLYGVRIEFERGVCESVERVKLYLLF
jgi:hypothetical protein